MDVTVYLDGNLRRFNPSNQPIHIAAGANLYEAKIAAGIPSTVPIAAVVNGTVTDLTYCLKPGDEVHMIPQIAGG